MSNHVHHLDLYRDQLKGARVAIIPGDPERVVKISKHLNNPEELSNKREFHSMLGYCGETPVAVVSTGIGGPSASVCIEELAQLGVKTFIRVGTTGALQPGINIGDIIISNAAIRREGTSHDFAPVDYPAVSDFGVTTALVQSVESLKIPHRIGISCTTDTFYQGQERYETFTGYVPRRLQGSLEEYQKLKVLNFEMETALVFTMCSSMGLKAGSVLAVAAVRTESESIADKNQFEQAEQRAIQVAVGAIPRLV